MRLNLTGFLCILLIVSCTRSNQPAPQPDPIPPLNPPPPVILSLPLLDSFKIYTLGPKEITLCIGKMNYDGYGRLIDVYETITDTTEEGQPLRSDTTVFTLIYTGSDSLPSAYTDLEVNLAYFEEFGFLSYDDQGRVSQDSGTNVNVNWLRKYQYGEKQIRRNNAGNVDSIQIGDHNVLSCSRTMTIDSFTYSAYPNPFYQPALANHVGALMVFQYIDIFSRNLFSSSQSRFVNYDPYLSTNYSWTKNGSGQVISGIGTDATTGKILQYYWFTYR